MTVDMTRICLASESDFAGFREAARRLLAQAIPPAQVTWSVSGRAADSLWDTLPETAVSPASPSGSAGAAAPDDPQANGLPTSGTPAWRVPRALLELMATASLHSDVDRHARMYRLLWRLRHDAALAGDALDADRLALEAMARAVRRDLHKMKAFVRFRPVDDGDARGPLHVAWFEPQHHIVQAIAPFFQRRFTAMRWAVLTPHGSILWQPGGPLRFGPAARREDAPGPDAGEALWLTYYRHTFNPARLKLAAMRREMPVRYWHNLPEASLISELTQSARVRSGQMIDAPSGAGRQRHRAVTAATQALREAAARSVQRCAPPGQIAAQITAQTPAPVPPTGTTGTTDSPG